MSKSKQNKAVALRYRADEDVSPVVIASGYGTIAEKIVDIAEQKGIPVFRDDSTASIMCMLEVGSNIPTELYEVVAAIYCQILKVSNEIKDNVEQAAKTSGDPTVRRARINEKIKKRRSSNSTENSVN